MVRGREAAPTRYFFLHAGFSRATVGSWGHFLLKMMWYHDLGVISIGAQTGGPRDGNLISLKEELWRALLDHCSKSHCSAVQHYALALRISGSSANFGDEGVEKIRRNRKEAYIGADIVISEARWSSFSENESRAYLARVIREAICACLGRLRKDHDPVDEIALLSEVDAAIAKFLAKER